MGNDTPSPFEQAIDGWNLGSGDFANRVRESLTPASGRPNQRNSRRTAPLQLPQVAQTIGDVLEVDPVVFSARGSRHLARALLAYLSRCYTDATLGQLAQHMGLSRADSVPTPIRRVTESPADSELRQQLRQVQLALGVPARRPKFSPG